MIDLREGEEEDDDKNTSYHIISNRTITRELLYHQTSTASSQLQLQLQLPSSVRSSQKTHNIKIRLIQTRAAYPPQSLLARNYTKTSLPVRRLGPQPRRFQTGSGASVACRRENLYLFPGERVERDEDPLGSWEGGVCTQIKNLCFNNHQGLWVSSQPTYTNSVHF
jgi:hypothetical protein